MPTCFATAPARIRKSSSVPHPASAGGISSFAVRAPIASTSTGPVSPQSRLQDGIGNGAGPTNLLIRARRRVGVRRHRGATD
jgi:hypothetical protein